MSMAIFYSNCHCVQVAFCPHSMPASVIFAFLVIANSSWSNMVSHYGFNLYFPN